MATVNVLFDLDGTLTDPGEGFVSCITHALSKLDCLRYSPAEIRRHIGPPLEETLEKLLDGDRAKVQAAAALYRERYGSVGYLENAVYPGIRKALEELKEREIALFVATSKPSVFARRILEHFGLAHLFRGIHGSELDGTRANKAHLIAHVLAVESLARASTVMFGDRSHDVAGALANGVRPIGVLWGYGTQEELAGAGAAALCEDPSQIAAVLAFP
ncbi:MAG: HAD family hydrolase [Betaproteobacteria bacterium]|nr:MAG: HAD family hydrolase [Betaproteobacteria bacterium]